MNRPKDSKTQASCLPLGSPVVPGDAGHGHHIGDPDCRQSLALKGPPADLAEKISKFSSQ